LDWREDGKRRTQSAGTTPRAALDAWMLRTGIQAGETEAPEEPAGADKKLTIDQAIRDYLVDVRATKGGRTYKAYGRQLQWFNERTSKRYVSELDRSDAMQMFALGREERHDGNLPTCGTFNATANPGVPTGLEFDHRRHIVGKTVVMAGGVRPFVKQGVVRQFAVRCKLLDERESVVPE
jgi:hypothetical protein